MKKAILFLCLIAILLAAVSFYRNNNLRSAVSVALAGGGRGDLEYRISLFGIIPVARAVFRAEEPKEYEGRPVYVLSATAESLAYYSFLLRGKVFLESYVDRTSGDPFIFRQRIALEGKPEDEKTVTYDQVQGIMVLGDVKRQIPPGTQDSLSAMYNMRRLDLGSVREFDINLNTNQKNYALKGTVRGSGIKVAGKVREYYVADARIGRRDKNPYHRSRMTMYFLKDGGNCPVLIKIFASGIYLSVQLTEAR